MRLVGEPSVAQRVEADGDALLRRSSAVPLRSVGYRSEAWRARRLMTSAPSPNEHGREGEEALYVSMAQARGCWRDLTNVNDAAETAAALLADRAAGLLGGGGGGGEAIALLLAAQPAPVVDFGGCSRSMPRARAGAFGKVRKR